MSLANIKPTITQAGSNINCRVKNWLPPSPAEPWLMRRTALNSDLFNNFRTQLLTAYQ